MHTLAQRFAALSHLNFTWRDALDIIVVAVITYALLRLIRGTRAVQMVIGLFAVFAVYAAASLLNLVALTTILKALIFYVPFAIIVLFSHELRRADSEVTARTISDTVSSAWNPEKREKNGVRPKTARARRSSCEKRTMIANGT